MWIADGWKDYEMIGQIEEQQTLMAEMILEMQNRDTQLSLMQEQNHGSV